MFRRYHKRHDMVPLPSRSASPMTDAEVLAWEVSKYLDQIEQEILDKTEEMEMWE